jgi:SHS2 domain-containing protein
MHEWIDHTADVGLRVTTSSLNELFAEAGWALFELVVANLSESHPTQERTIELAADDLETLLFDWLSELLFVFETEALVLSRFEVQVDETACTLRARVQGQALSLDRHALGHEVKAVTYHQLSVHRHADDWQAQVILDI